MKSILTSLLLNWLRLTLPLKLEILFNQELSVDHLTTSKQLTFISMPWKELKNKEEKFFVEERGSTKKDITSNLL
jgi:hypothetical protein